jgi:purine-nucleoside phosphorylase
MSFEQRFREARAARYQEWLAAMRAWLLGTAENFTRLSRGMILVHSSRGQPQRFLTPLLSDVQTFGDFPAQGGGAAVGLYRGTPIWIIHQPMGCTASQLFMECLTDSPVRYLIGLAEMTGYPEHVHMGDLIVPTAAVRGDIVTDFHASPEVPAVADLGLTAALEVELCRSGHPLHVGPIFSGLPGGSGIHNPILKALIWSQIQSGMLGGGIEVSTTLLEAARLGIRAAAAWTVSDDIFRGGMADGSVGRANWASAWDLMARASLEVLHQAATGALP